MQKDTLAVAKINKARAGPKSNTTNNAKNAKNQD